MWGNHIWSECQSSITFIIKLLYNLSRSCQSFFCPFCGRITAFPESYIHSTQLMVHKTFILQIYSSKLTKSLFHKTNMNVLTCSKHLEWSNHVYISNLLDLSLARLMSWLLVKRPALSIWPWENIYYAVVGHFIGRQKEVVGRFWTFCFHQVLAQKFLSNMDAYN